MGEINMKTVLWIMGRVLWLIFLDWGVCNWSQLCTMDVSMMGIDGSIGGVGGGIVNERN